MFKTKRSVKVGDVPCIFVHAGAGYHSVANENVHLQACLDATRAGMAVLRAGGCAVDAVEIAIKILEDREITNSGYGSNLAIDGVVECDAVVVDHNGRSGGVGAVAQIKNPISLARMVLDHTSLQLSLKRVPPNLLVGQGATDFAAEHDMSVLPYDALVSPAARDRWLRWKSDMETAERRKANEVEHSAQYSVGPTPVPEPHVMRKAILEDNARRAHTNAMESGVWNDAQPVSPPSSDNVSRASPKPASVPASTGSRSTPELLDYEEDGTTMYTDPYGPPHAYGHYATPSAFHLPTTTGDGHRTILNTPEAEIEMSDYHDMDRVDVELQDRLPRSSRWNDGSSDSDRSVSTATSLRLPSLTPSPPNSVVTIPAPQALSDAKTIPIPQTPDVKKQEPPSPENSIPRDHVRQNVPLPDRTKPKDDFVEEDMITDTVGAIAIDCFGNIACGASSGGIGMKHRGRIGPAALVGVGASVIPIDAEDKSKTCVGVVTSGTGEHMSTTLAGKVFAERLYCGMKKVRGGGFELSDDDNDIIRETIEREFMGHPSVKSTPASAAAIGLLAVKRTKEGVYIYFAHNTDSFAMASQGAEETQPTCTMSRNSGNGAIALGGRAFRHRKKRI